MLAVLVRLAHYEGVNQAALAEVLGIKPMTLVRLLDRLEGAGLIRRMPDPQDRRAYNLLLTPRALPNPVTFAEPSSPIGARRTSDRRSRRG
jgi:DNA-binding MarR family transcriptional regulator